MEHFKKYWIFYFLLGIAIVTVASLLYIKNLKNKNQQVSSFNTDDDYTISPHFKKMVNKLKAIYDDKTVNNFIKVVWPAWRKSETVDLIKYGEATQNSKPEINNTGVANEYELAWNKFMDSLNITCCHTKGGYFYNRVDKFFPYTQ